MQTTFLYRNLQGSGESIKSSCSLYSQVFPCRLYSVVLFTVCPEGTTLPQWDQGKLLPCLWKKLSDNIASKQSATGMDKMQRHLFFLALTLEYNILFYLHPILWKSCLNLLQSDLGIICFSLWVWKGGNVLGVCSPVQCLKVMCIGFMKGPLSSQECFQKASFISCMYIAFSQWLQYQKHAAGVYFGGKSPHWHQWGFSSQCKTTF